MPGREPARARRLSHGGEAPPQPAGEDAQCHQDFTSEKP